MLIVALFSTYYSSSKVKATSSKYFFATRACLTIVTSSVWNLLINGLAYIESISKTVDKGKQAEKFAIECIRPTMERVGLEDQDSDDYSMPKLR